MGPVWGWCTESRLCGPGVLCVDLGWALRYVFVPPPAVSWWPRWARGYLTAQHISCCAFKCPISFSIVRDSAAMESLCAKYVFL